MFKKQFGQRGQALVYIGIGLGLIALVIVATSNHATMSPQGQSYRQQAVDSAA